MQCNAWTQALYEIVDAVVVAFVRFWKQDIVQAGLSFLIILALAVPLLIVILVLWYIDSTGWRPADGFYKIGLSTTNFAFDADVYTAWLVAWFFDVLAPLVTLY